MSADVQGALSGIESFYDVQARFMDSTLWLLGVFERNPDLIAKFWPFVSLQLSIRLIEIVFQEIKESRVVFL